MSELDVIPKDVFYLIFDKLDILSLRFFASTCKKNNKLIRTYLNNVCFQKSFIEKQAQMLSKIEKKLNMLMDMRHRLSKSLDIFSKYDGLRPDAEMCYHKELARKRCPSTYESLFTWMPVKVYANDIKRRRCNYIHSPKKCENCIIYVKSGYSLESYQRIYAMFYEIGWKQTFIAQKFKGTPTKENPLIQLAFAPGDHSKIAEFKGCKCCGSILHTIFECPSALCKICKKRGHVSRQCKNAVCELCKTKGHIVKYCPDFCCAKCKKQGHSSKQCKQAGIKAVDYLD